MKKKVTLFEVVGKFISLGLNNMYVFFLKVVKTVLFGWRFFIDGVA